MDLEPGIIQILIFKEPWTLSEQDHLDNSSDQTTLSSVKQELVTIGLKVTTLKELNLLTQFWMSSERKLKDVIAYKVSKSHTHSEEVPDQVWELFWSPKSEKSIQIESWKHSQLSHHQKSQIQSLNHTMLPSQYIN